MQDKLTSINVLLQLGCHSTPGIIEFEKEAHSHQCWILLDVLRNVHLRLVDQYVGRQLFIHKNKKKNEEKKGEKCMSEGCF